MPRTTCGFDSVGSLSGADRFYFYGPTLLVDIGFDPSYNPASSAAPDLAVKNLGALVDTGANLNCIDSSLALQLKLPIVNRRSTSGVNGAKEMNIHVAQVYIPSLNWFIWGEFAGADLVAGGQPHHVIVGRGFLRRFSMTYDGITGTVILESQ